MRGLHWVAIGGFFGALSALIVTLPDWQSALHPAFIGSAIGLFGSFVVALLSGGPVEGSRTEELGQSLKITPKDN